MTRLAKMAAAADMARKSIQPFSPPKTDFRGVGKEHTTNCSTANTQNQPSGCQNLLLKWTSIIGAHGGFVAKMGINHRCITGD